MLKAGAIAHVGCERLAIGCVRDGHHNLGVTCGNRLRQASVIAESRAREQSSEGQPSLGGAANAQRPQQRSAAHLWSTEQTLIPPNRCFETRSDSREVLMVRVDDDVSFHARDD